MNSPASQPKPTKFNLKNCLLNLLILIISLVMMLVFGEIILRWLDGYPLFDLRLY